MPETNATTNKMPTTFKESFILSLCLNKTNKPNPAFVDKPAIKEPKPITFFK